MMPTRDEAIEAVKAAFEINSEARRIALDDAIKACKVVDEGDALGAFGQGFEAGVKACIEAIEALRQ